MMRRWIACFTLLLSACLMSESPRIPRSELVQPTDLPGWYWSTEFDGSSHEPGVFEFRRRQDGTWAVRNENDSDGTVRLVDLHLRDLYLSIVDLPAEIGAVNSRPVSRYGLLVRRALGVWDKVNFGTIGSDPVFRKADLAYMQAIAARYGLGIDARIGSDTLITGDVHGMAIPQLFRDREFLAALRLRPLGRFLPRPPDALPIAPPRVPYPPPGFPLSVEQPSLAGAQWVRPQGFAGDFVRAIGGPHFLDLEQTSFKPLADGRFERMTNGSREEVFGLLALDAELEHYLWVSFDCGTPTAPCLALSILRPNYTGWTVERILERYTVAFDGLDDSLAATMNKAAARQGVTLKKLRLEGGITAQGLLALLHDGQFTTGLRADERMAKRYVSVEAALRSVPLGR